MIPSHTNQSREKGPTEMIPPHTKQTTDLTGNSRGINRSKLRLNYRLLADTREWKLSKAPPELSRRRQPSLRLSNQHIMTHNYRVLDNNCWSAGRKIEEIFVNPNKVAYNNILRMYRENCNLRKWYKWLQIDDNLYTYYLRRMWTNWGIF